MYDHYSIPIFEAFLTQKILKGKSNTLMKISGIYFIYENSFAGKTTKEL